MSGEGAQLALRGLVKRFPARGKGREILALDGIDLEVRAGEFVLLLGPSGCGKSTLLNIVAGFERPTQGDAYLDGQPIRGPGPDRAVGAQSPALFPWLSVAGPWIASPNAAPPPARIRAVRPHRHDGAVTRTIDASPLLSRRRQSI